MSLFEPIPPVADRNVAAKAPGATAAGSQENPQKSWVIWLEDGRYSYAWGESEAIAKFNWLMAFGNAVSRIVPAGDYKSALPVERYLREANVHG